MIGQCALCQCFRRCPVSGCSADCRSRQPTLDVSSTPACKGIRLVTVVSSIALLLLFVHNLILQLLPAGGCHHSGGDVWVPVVVGLASAADVVDGGCTSMRAGILASAPDILFIVCLQHPYVSENDDYYYRMSSCQSLIRDNYSDAGIRTGCCRVSRANEEPDTRIVSVAGPSLVAAVRCHRDGVFRARLPCAVAAAIGASGGPTPFASPPPRIG